MPPPRNLWIGATALYWTSLLDMMAQRLARRGWRSGGPRFKSHSRLISQSWSSYQLNQLGSKAASDSTLKQLTVDCFRIWRRRLQKCATCRWKKAFFQTVWNPQSSGQDWRRRIWIRKIWTHFDQFELDIFVKNSRKSSCDQLRRALWAAQAITSPPICLSFVPFHRDSCFSCPQRFGTNDWQRKHRCTGASGSQCRFRHCGPLDHVTGAARSILCWRQSPGMVWVISMWPNANLPGQRSTISTSQSRLRCPTGIGAGSTKIHRLHRRFGRTHWWILSEPSHVRGRHSDDWTDDNSWHSRHHNETSKLHRSNSGMVQVATTSTESGKNRTDLVRVKGQSKEDGRSWLELVQSELML